MLYACTITICTVSKSLKPCIDHELISGLIYNMYLEKYSIAIKIYEDIVYKARKSDRRAVIERREERDKII